MKVNVVYPNKNVKEDLRRSIIYYAKFLFIIAAITCLVINILYPTSWWSTIVIWSLFLVWKLFFSPTLIENNRTSVAVQTSLHVAFLVVIIYLVYPSWPGLEVASLVVAGGLVITATLFFSNVARQKNNVFPLLIFALVAIIFGTIVFIYLYKRPLGWAMIVAIGLSLAIILSTVIILRINIFREIKKRFIL